MHKSIIIHQFLTLLIDQQLHKLTLTDHTIPILIHTFENFLNVLATLELILQEFYNFFECNLAAVIDIEVGECLFEVFLGYFCFEIDCGY